jgi:hypothetical protein
MVAQNNNNNDKQNYTCDCQQCLWFLQFPDEQSIINEFISRRGRNPTAVEIYDKKDFLERCVRFVGKIASLTEQEFKDLIYHDFIDPSNLAWFEEDYDQLSPEEKQDIATFTRYSGEAVSSYEDIFFDCEDA